MQFLRNAWYMGAWANEVGDKPLGRILLKEPVVMFRDKGGHVVAISDACPHRGVPLSLGNVENRLVRCPYHALEFDGQGICQRNPHVNGPPNRLRTKSYRVEERHAIVWIWIGEEELADPDLIVDYSLFSETAGYVTVTGHLNIGADYRLIIDNLMDLAHAEYLHPATVGTVCAAENGTAKLVKTDDAISVNALWPNSAPNAVTRSVWDKSESVDQYTDITWRAPANLSLDIAVTEPNRPRGSGLHMPSAHILTPASERTTHYFWAFGRDFHLDSDQMSAAIRDVVETAFITEDAPIIEAAQRMLDLTGQRLLNFTVGDAGSAEVRRAIERRISDQADCAAAA